MIVKLALIAGGGAAGALLRYGVFMLCRKWPGLEFPIGTLAVNVIGCIAIGFLSALFAAAVVREEYRALLVIGVLGSFTTFSAFGWETIELANGGHMVRAGLYVLLSVALGLAAVWAGLRLGQVWAPSAAG